MTRYSSNFQPQAHLIEAKHRQSLELSSAVASVMLIIQASFGTAVLHRIQNEVHAVLEAEHAVP